MSNKFKVGDEVYCSLTGKDSVRGVIKMALGGRYDVTWFYNDGTNSGGGLRYAENELDLYANHPNEVKKRKEMQVKKLEDYSFDLTRTTTTTVTPKMVYTRSNDLRSVRELIERGGLEITDFRPPIDGDIYIAAAHGTTTETTDKGDWRPMEPRFIVTRPRNISDTEIINFIERNRMGWGVNNDGYVFSYMGHHREEGKNFREAVIKHIHREERKES